MPNTHKRMNYRQNGIAATYLCACALQGKTPEWHTEWNLDELHRFCKFHSITSIVTMALEAIWETAPVDEEIMRNWRQDRDKVIRKNILLNAERERILAYLESIDCWYMPLKGSLLQFDYPKFGMRQMSDNDLLCDPLKTHQIHQFMLESGYTCGQFDQGHHDEYSRKPVYNFEIHRTLFKPEEAPLLASYYADIHDRSLKDDHNQFGYHLSLSDFYIYIMAHALNHFQESGIGIRHLMDVYVFLNKYAGELDRPYVDQELDKLGALEFARWCERIGYVLFADASYGIELSEEDQALLDAFFASGSHGTETQLFRKSYEKFVKKSGRSGFLYFLFRMFPTSERLGVTYPILKKYKWTLPFVWVYRLVRSVFTKPGRVFREIRDIVSKDKM